MARSIRTRTSTHRRRRPRIWPRSLAITTTPSLPIRPACRVPKSKSRDSTTAKKSADWSTWLTRCDNTIQLSWLVEMATALFGLNIETIGPENCDHLYDEATKAMAQPDWAAEVLRRSRLEAVFLTNDFDDPLADFDTADVRSLPAYRRIGVLAFDRHGLRPAGAGRRRRGARRTITCWRRSANCSNISSGTAPEPALFRCRPISPSAGFASRGRRRLRCRLAARSRGRRRSAANARPISSFGRWPSTAPSSNCRST